MGFKAAVRFLVLASLLNSGCGSGSNGNNPGTSVGGFTSNLRAIYTYSEAEVSQTQAGERVIRTKLAVHFAPDAGAEDLAAFLQKYDASITTSVEGLTTVVVRIPDPGSLEDLDTLVASAEAEPAVVAVRRSVLPRPMTLPANIDTSNLSPIDHHLAVRAAPAWNAKRAVASPTSLFVIDYFGQGVPNTSYLDIILDADDFANCTGPCPNAGHGYRLLGIISGLFDNAPADAAGTVTGIHPSLALVNA